MEDRVFSESRDRQTSGCAMVPFFMRWKKHLLGSVGFSGFPLRYSYICLSKI